MYGALFRVLKYTFIMIIENHTVTLIINHTLKAFLKMWVLINDMNPVQSQVCLRTELQREGAADGEGSVP